mmetsp:Transcript_86464/g.241999  ORF Transcript_86464/g.241999 Transcript_86464/m.241999 type:complete len:399 (+) Transcript_86464:48-1244(+)
MSSVGGSGTTVSHGTEKCFACNANTKKGFFCPHCPRQWKAACENCVARGVARCESCRKVAQQQDIRTDSDLRSVYQSASTASGNVAPAGALPPGSESQCPTSVNMHVMSGSNLNDVLENLRNTIAILENSQPLSEHTPVAERKFTNASSASRVDTVTSSDMRPEKKTPVAALNESIQQIHGCKWAWTFESPTPDTFVAVVEIVVPGGPPMEARSLHPAASKLAAKHSAAIAALPLLRELESSVSRQACPSEESEERFGSEALPEQQEMLQKKYHDTRQWKQEGHPEDSQGFRGASARGKQEAKRSALECALRSQPRFEGEAAPESESVEMPSDDKILSNLRAALRPLPVRELYLLSLGRDPKHEKIGSGVKACMNKRLAALQKAKRVTSSEGRWSISA